ncbi:MULTISPECIES: TauD/TfdA family dioxygenase [unclassified Streptomyces]|uniref:TauD/TfdA dioxygenase family protein n=1 Tax=unclassified Streptomyces TaxID=2593676 RepID=UPI002E10521F|nr:TauD/TfdA family dioxygenase [Streptomyces sp. NBC_01197]WSS47833.1 TauD/TfdA family dioxygenase [Streptomyces sp. NBC_01180]
MKSVCPTGFKLELLTPTIGGVVHGLDLRDELSPKCQDELRQTLLEREVLFLRDQQIEPGDQLRFARIFGEPQEVSAFFPSLPDNRYIEVLESRGRASGTDVWHSDLTWQPTPNAATCLHSQEVPPCGGDTLWASMTAAYDAIPEDVKKLIDPLDAVHDWERELSDHVRSGEEGEKRYAETREKYPPRRHPVVRTHPVTGRKLVYVNELYSTRIAGVDHQLSESLLRYLVGLARVPEFQARFRWDANAIAIWDNRSVQHYAVGDYHPHYRKMHRVTLKGDAPF